MKQLFTFLSVALITLNALAGEKHKVIFDCDLGDDIDDAFAMAMILASEDIEVLGFCMDYANTEDRSVLACRLLYETGKEDIPVYVGRKTSNSFITQHIWGEGFEKLKPQKKGAAEFIVETLNKYPGEVSLITVGPVTNMQDVIQLDENALSKAKHIYAMFGSFYMGYGSNPVISPEWNVRADEEASKIYTSNVSNISYAGLDITTFVKWDDDRMMKLMMHNTPLTEALTSLTTIWRHGQKSRVPTLYDCVAVGMLLWPDLFVTRPAHVRVIKGGYTVIDESQKTNGLVGMEIREEEFLNRLMDLYMNQNLMRKL